MLVAAFAQARTPRLYLQCRHKSNLSAINRSLDHSIRRDRRKALDDLNKVRDERGGDFPWLDRSDNRSDDRKPNTYDDRRSNTYTDRKSNNRDDRKSNSYNDRRDGGASRGRDFAASGRGRDQADTPRGRDFAASGRGRDQADAPRGRDFAGAGKGRGYSDTPRGRDYAGSGRDTEVRDRGFKKRDDGNHLKKDASWRDDIHITPEADQAGAFAIRKSNKLPTHTDLTDDQKRDVLKVPFNQKSHFTPENWNRLMAALKEAEDKYINALPKRPSTLPTFAKDKSSLEIKQELKKTVKADLAKIEPTLRRERQEWLRVLQHAGDAIRNAKAKYIFIPGRRWFEEGDPQSAMKATVYPIQPPANPEQGADWNAALRDISVLNQDMRGDFIKNMVNRHAEAIISGKDVQDEEVYLDKVGSSKLSRQEKELQKEKDAKMDQFAFKEDKERRRLEEESRLDDNQLFTSVRKNRETNNDNKNKYKEIQEPRDRRDRTDEDRDSRSSPRSSRDNRDIDDYVSIPYTTAASEFLYGYNTVIAALRAKRRTIYMLYIHKRAASSPKAKKDMMTLCKHAKLPYKEVDDHFLPKMDKMAQGRPHNGVILEASPIPILPTKSLGKMGVTYVSIPIVLAEQSAEEVAIRGRPSSIPFHYTHTWRNPLVLLLDGILDPGNLGNILRTAHFYGVDAVAICTNTCAPVNLPIVQKAASGAAEALTILSIPTPANFITLCRKNNWLVHAAVAPGAASATTGKKSYVTSNMISPLSRGPSILMIGAEGEGLRANLATKADANVGIKGSKPPALELDVGVDSLNVGSSVAVLLEAFMRKPDNLDAVPDRTIPEGTGDIVAKIL
ncbi:hypothetical protein E4T42_06851 [Aureobasidium subglaciale]|nr:hypothetical protein E4T42_06851 [Aureobasidium subglaciale]